jgi:hypothetical protein
MPAKKNTTLNNLADILVALLCLGGIAAAGWSFRQDLNRSLVRLNEVPVGSISYQYRAVQRRFTNRVLWDRLSQNSRLYNGDFIHTLSRSEAHIALSGGAYIRLSENSLVQIFAATLEEPSRVELSSGSISALGGNGTLLVSSGEKTLTLAPGDLAALSSLSSSGEITSDPEDLSAFRAALAEQPELVPITPAEGGSYGAASGIAAGTAIHFRWLRTTPEPSYYLLEVADNPDIKSPELSFETRGSNAVSSALGEGTWYWRVTPVYVGVQSGTGNPSRPVSFTVTAGAPSSPPSAAVPAAGPSVSAPSAASPGSAGESVVLPAPEGRSPANAVFNADYFRNNNSIPFSWNAVSGAEGYIITILEEGGRQLLSEQTQAPSFTLRDFSILNRGRFVWRVEALGQNKRGSAGESRFTVDIPAIRQNQINDAGTMYGNN